MKYTVNMKKKDYYAFSAHTAKMLMKPYSWLFTLKNVFLWMFFGILFMSFFQYLTGNTSRYLFHAVLIPSVPVLVYLRLCKVINQKTTKCFQPNLDGIMLGSKEYELTNEGIKEIHLHGYNFYKWSVVQSVKEVDEAVYVYVDQVLALIFTEDAFESAKSKEEFIQTVQKYSR